MDEKQGENLLPKLFDSSDITNFFYNAVKAAQNSSEIKLTENVEFYLVQLLCNFIKVDGGNTLSENLVLLLQKASESLPNEQILIYKKLADTTLYLSGFFQEYFSNKSFNIKYYISIGQLAFDNLSILMVKNGNNQKTMSNIYEEMRDSFLDSVDVLLCVSEQTNFTQPDRSPLNIYETWIDTESAKLEKNLLNLGIIPIPNLNKKVQ